MGYLLFAGLVSLFFGVLFLFSPEVLSSLGKMLNQTVMVLDEALNPIRSMIGFLLIIVGGWMLWMVFPYADLWYLNLVAAIILFFGMLFVFFPVGLKALSDISNVVLLSTDEVVMASRKTVGILLIILSVYIFYSAFYAVTPAKAK